MMAIASCSGSVDPPAEVDISGLKCCSALQSLVLVPGLPIARMKLDPRQDMLARVKDRTRQLSYQRQNKKARRRTSYSSCEAELDLQHQLGYLSQELSESSLLPPLP